MLHLHIHPENPQARLITQAVERIRAGDVVGYPTDAAYAIGCQIGNKSAMERIAQIRGLGPKHQYAIMCCDLSDIATYAKVDNSQFRLLKANTPGSYTFILQASKEVPRRLQHPKRNTIGLRIPDHPVAHALLAELDEPILSSTLILPGDELPLTDPEEIRHQLEHQIELVLAANSCGIEMTTVIDLTTDTPALIRQGKGSLKPFGLTS